MEIGEVKDLNVLDLLQYKYLVVTDPENSMKTFSSKITSKVKAKTEVKSKAKTKAKVEAKPKAKAKTK